MRSISLTTLVVPLFLLGLGPANQANAVTKKERGFTSHCYGTPEQCMRGYRAMRPTPRQAPRGYLPPQRSYGGGNEYDFPKFGTQRWWELEEDRD